MVEKHKQFIIQRKSKFQGQRKVGIDSCVLIDFIDTPFVTQYQQLKIFGPADLFFTHPICKSETIAILSDKKRLSSEEAEKQVSEFLINNNISLVELGKGDSLLVHFRADCKNHNVEIHEPDDFILVDFKACGINKIYSTNNHFLEAAKLLGMEADKVPTIENQMKRIISKTIFKR